MEDTSGYAGFYALRGNVHEDAPRPEPQSVGAMKSVLVGAVFNRDKRSFDHRACKALPQRVVLPFAFKS